MKVLQQQVLPWKPDYVFTGHGPRKNGTEFVHDLLKRTKAALRQGSRK
jgi:hypothetical protein